MGDLPSPVLIAIFLVGGVATWLAGTALSRTTDALDNRLHLGEAIGGVVLLAISGSLPEVARQWCSPCAIAPSVATDP